MISSNILTHTGINFITQLVDMLSIRDYLYILLSCKGIFDVWNKVYKELPKLIKREVNISILSFYTLSCKKLRSYMICYIMLNGNKEGRCIISNDEYINISYYRNGLLHGTICNKGRDVNNKFKEFHKYNYGVLESFKVYRGDIKIIYSSSLLDSNDYEVVEVYPLSGAICLHYVKRHTTYTYNCFNKDGSINTRIVIKLVEDIYMNYITEFIGRYIYHTSDIGIDTGILMFFYIDRLGII